MSCNVLLTAGYFAGLAGERDGKGVGGVKRGVDRGC